MNEENICKICGNPKTASGSGRLTQFISICNCNLVLDQSESQMLLDIQLCQNCGKRIGKGREGSITQFIFRADICECENPRPIHARVESPVSDNQTITGQEEDEDELEIDAKNFPVERYKPIAEIGSGTGGDVYLARDRILNKLVAVKTLKSVEPDEII